MILYRTHTLAPVCRPPIADGAILVDGERIVDVGPWAELRETHGDGVPAHDLGRAIVIPGLVNAHTHLELAWLEAETLPQGDYLAWVRELMARRATADTAAAREAAALALEAMRARGTVALGDVGNEGFSGECLAASDLHAVCFHEVYGFRTADADAALEAGLAQLARLEADATLQAASPRVRLAITAHAPHTGSATLLRALAGRSAAAATAFSIHTAESRAEVMLLADGSGPLPDFYRERDFWDDEFVPPHQTPVEYLDRLGALGERTLVVHAVHLERHDHAKLQARRCTVVGCPRSNERLGVGTAPLPELLAEGIPVALGTDSRASAPDLDLFGEMAAVRRLHPALTPAAILRMATLNGARALGFGDELGTIEEGKRSALAVIAIPADGEPLATLCEVPETVHRLEDAPFESVS